MMMEEKDVGHQYNQYLIVVSIALSLTITILQGLAMRDKKRLTNFQEKRLKPLKFTRIGICILIAASQITLITLQSILHGFPQQINSSELGNASSLFAWLTLLVSFFHLPA